MANIAVIGSGNMDTTNYLKGEFPEDLTSENENAIYKTSNFLGGKGANQAVSTKTQADAKDKVYFIGCVGKDEAGLKIIEELKRREIDYSGVKVLDDFKTDGRYIFVDSNGNNKMFGYGNCIKQLTPDMIKEKRIQEIIEKADIVVIQMKMPAETVKDVIEYCNKSGKKIIIDPTPTEKSSFLLEDDLLKKATYLTPNEEEAIALAYYMQGKTLEDAKKAFEELTPEERLRLIRNLVLQHPNIIATLGEKGVMYNRNGEIVSKKPYPTECKDSTGAGDTFNGSFVAALARGEKLDEAIEYALMASSQKVAHEGAQNGIPTLEETREALKGVKRKT